MKRYLTVLVLIFSLLRLATAQTLSPQPTNTALGPALRQQADSLKQVATHLLADPLLYNDAYAKFLAGVSGDSTQIFKFMRDLNVNFKTFQANDQPASLGLDYAYQNSWTKAKVKGANAGFQSYALNFSGNVAYRVADNPANLLESQFTYNSSFMRGGNTRPLDSAERKQFLSLKRALIQANISGNTKLVQQLYRQQLRFVQTANQYYMGINGNFSYETNQDFSRQQFVPGILVNLGAKAWNSQEALLYFNIPDYPFALIRLITGTDQTFTLSGASFPTGLVGIDHVIPGQDSVRKSLTGNLDAFNRFRYEIGFKTEMAQVGQETLYFSADFRYYRELNAPRTIRLAHLAAYNYFTASIQATNGFFVSYACGRLPFDQQNSSTYGLGLHYDLGSFKK